jgi:hypothetical protein
MVQVEVIVVKTGGRAIFLKEHFEFLRSFGTKCLLFFGAHKDKNSQKQC